MSSFMLSHLASVVASDTRTSTGFKKVHLNACARDVNEKFNTNRTGDQIKKHLKTWQRRYAKINRLMRVSASGWDEDNCIITLDRDYYNGYIQNHKADAEFFNKPLEHYGEMAAIFGNIMMTGKFAKDSSSALGTEDAETEVEVDGTAVPTTPEDGTAVPRPNKRAKLAPNEDMEDGLIGAFKYSSEKIATAIEKIVKGNMDLPDDLIEKVQELPGFDDTHKSFYHAHLVEQPHVGRAFYNSPFLYKLNFIAKWISEKFPG